MNSIGNNVGDSIEAEQAILTARKISPKLPWKHQDLRKQVFPFEIHQNAEALIHKELNPKKPVLSQDSLVDKGDCIRGMLISGYSLKKVPNRTVVPRTGRHKANTVRTEKFTFAEVDRPWQWLNAAEAPQYERSQP